MADVIVITEITAIVQETCETLFTVNYTRNGEGLLIERLMATPRGNYCVILKPYCNDIDIIPVNYDLVPEDMLIKTVYQSGNA